MTERTGERHGDEIDLDTGHTLRRQIGVEGLVDKSDIASMLQETQRRKLESILKQTKTLMVKPEPFAEDRSESIWNDSVKKDDIGF